ncbi:MAG: hypothetical protein HKN67_09235 [Saprospiraceae bacterium]|nr:hypothetical protein [Bacteroidia bacterium]MBT8229282.1 hypothetical protein [Bacteroidia bacterium]NNF22113.1 hypothetical protein [Saprospiraceae bacterium]
MKYFYLILFLFFNVNGFDTIEAQQVDEDSMSADISLNGVISGTQGTAIQLDFDKDPELDGAGLMIRKYLLDIVHSDIQLLDVNRPRIDAELLKHLCFQSHLDDEGFLA